MLEVVPTLDAESYDGCCTDPPYHLTTEKRWSSGPPTKSVGAFARANTGFMGETWDGGDVAFRPETWRAVYDALKPGAHLTAFAAARNVHRLTCAIEDAGFEIRDQLLWLYGTGFPKSLDVSKALDKARFEDEVHIRVLCRAVRAAMDARGLISRDLVEHFGDCHPRLIDHWAARDTDSQPNVPTPQQWRVLEGLFEELAPLSEAMHELNNRKGAVGDAYRAREITGTAEEWSNRANYSITLRENVRRDRAQAGTLAEQYEGWGTALKPAYEPIVLARKPFRGSVAKNVYTFGTAGLNVGACRIGDELLPAQYAGEAQIGTFERVDMVTPERVGRFPANVLHDGSHEVIEMLGDKAKYFAECGYVEADYRRAFYWGKAKKTDRRGSGHPTVKPRALMEWLLRLTIPQGGRVLDPFAGSGATGWAAKAMGLDPTLVEMHPQHFSHLQRVNVADTFWRSVRP